MRELNSGLITDVVRRLAAQSNCILPDDVRACIAQAKADEPSDIARGILDKIEQNYRIAEQDFTPICQDTGMCCVFIELGQDVHITGDLATAVDEGVRLGYREGYLRNSVVRDPLRRGNTGDNTPAMLTVDIVPGDSCKITVAPKGFGSENMSTVKMLRPSDGVDGVIEFVLDVVRAAGPNPCPPIVVGVGIGGTFDKVALTAKKALLRPLGEPNPDGYYSELERTLLTKVNELGIGPQGFGGKTTALAVHVDTLPTHIAALPCAVNINCHVTRHMTEVL